LMIFVNHLTKQEKLDKSVLHQFLLILNPFAPHISEELNEMLGFELLSNIAWPEYDKSKIIEEKIIIAVQINGKRRGQIEIEKGLDKEQVIEQIKYDKSFDKYFADKSTIKEIYVENRLVNFVVK